jgi:mannose-6-phosphate isomerase-like protein (cupin superfamily)
MTDDTTQGYVRHVDLDEYMSTGERLVAKLLGQHANPVGCQVSLLRTPPGGGSSRGLHTHEFDQIYFVLSGTMGIEIDDTQFEVGRGDLIIFPAGTPHRNWTAGSVPAVHLAIASPVR